MGRKEGGREEVALSKVACVMSTIAQAHDGRGWLHSHSRWERAGALSTSNCNPFFFQEKDEATYTAFTLTASTAAPAPSGDHPSVNQAARTVEPPVTAAGQAVRTPTPKHNNRFIVKI